MVELVSGMSRRSRRRGAWCAIFALLFMQVAMAAYDCPYLTHVPRNESGMPMDCTTGAGSTAQPSLCQAHGDTQSQFKNDQTPVPLVAPVAVMALLESPFATSGDSIASRLDSYAQARLAPDGSPPLFVRHVVFRK